MNLATLTKDQCDCVTHVSGPLLVSAGAGSGKTFMLTQRIAYALLNRELSGVRDIDEVLAITFTELAASEIKARVRTRLREEGLAQEALKVDASWISTIHGMCSRILHESALDLGLDPHFGLLDETDRAQLLTDCVNEALAEARGERGPAEAGEGATVLPAYRELFSEYEKADGSSNVDAMVTRLINTAANVRGGLDAVALADPESAHEIALDMLRAMEDCDAVARTGIGTNGKSKETFTNNARRVLEDTETGMPAFEQLAARADLTHRDVARALMKVDLSFGSRTSKDPFATAYAVFKAAFIDACANCALGMAAPARAELLTLARRVQQLFDEAKANRGALDQNDLLLKTLDAFETCPEVKARYCDRFKLVMVDEFQDTSGLQIALIDHLTDNGRRLCTVGDTQQSIYRFRGADVQTYRDHKEVMRTREQDGGLCRELSTNFRSHGDIIAFVNKIFGDPEVFGANGEFIELQWVVDHAEHNPFPDVARVDVVATTSTRSDNAGTDTRHLVEAEAIAQRFEKLHANKPNQRWGDMVILLGTMKRAEVYARTLRAHNIPCIVSGGSGFAWTPEAQEVSALLNAVANPWDDVNLRMALCGSAFGLGAEELLHLCNAPDGTQRHLWSGLLARDEKGFTARMRLASTLLADAVASAGARGTARTLTDLVVSSGWLDRLQGQGPQGMASAANILKAIRLAESVENDPATPRGVPATAARVARKLADGIKEKPGSLMTAGQDAVRILTIHASKGLEFPIVALADFYGLQSETERLRLETLGETIYLSLNPSASIADGTEFEGLLDTKLTETQRGRLADGGHFDVLDIPELGAAKNASQPYGALQLHRAIVAHNRTEELGELRRKFYVGATRPREALIVAVCMEKKKELVYGDVLDDLRRGLFGPDGDYVTAPEGIDFGGKRRATTKRLRLERNACGSLLVNDTLASDFLKPELFACLAGSAESETDSAATPTSTLEKVPEVPGPGEHLRELTPGKRPCNPLRAGTFSYSHLSTATSHGAEPTEVTDPDELPGYAGPRSRAEDENGEEPGDMSTDSALGVGPNASTCQPSDDPTRTDASAAQVDTPYSPVAFGSALHQACQLMVEACMVRRDGKKTAYCPEMPSRSQLNACLATWKVPAGRLPELEQAVGLWAASDVAAEAFSYPDLAAEAPFYVTLQGPQGEPIHLEGSIDLFCRDHSLPTNGQRVLVVDYKTGGRPTETPEQLRAKHELQAMCYAYAVLSQGYAGVNLTFVRVQQHDLKRPDQPQTVRYGYNQEQVQALEERIRAAYATLGRPEPQKAALEPIRTCGDVTTPPIEKAHAAELW